MIKVPIVTTREGNQIKKVCVEDCYKMINRIIEPLNKLENSLDSLDKKYITEDGEEIEGSLVIGTGISQPCIIDAFDEEIGNNLAFMKAKLNANIKKFRFLRRVINNTEEVNVALSKELNKVIELINMDLEGIRRHNPDFNPAI